MENSSMYDLVNMNPSFEISIKICRICWSKVTIQDADPFYKPLDDGFTISEILEEISNIKVDKDSNLTDMVCKNCTKIIFDFRYLIKTFYETEEFLKTSLSKKELVSKTSDSEDQKQFKNDNNQEIFYNDDESATFDSDHGETFEEDVIDNPLSSNIKSNDQNIDSVENIVNEESVNKEIFPVNIKENSVDDDETKVFENESETEEVSTTKYACEICGDCFLFKSGFGHHMLMVHNICIQVNQYEQYSSQITIRVPKGLPENETKYVRKSNPPIPLYKTEVECKKCKQTFSSVEALKEHNEVHKTFRCDQCGAAFIKNSYLRDHLLKHSSDKCYSCKDCGQAFKYRSALAIHRRDHVGNLTGHMCETCGRNFKERGTLKTHIMLKHTNERNFPCSGCDLTFKLKAARDKHYLRKHTYNRTKDFVCSTCGMAYLNKETLTRHMGDKHTGRPSLHWCTVCQKSFTMKSNLSKHLRNKHNVIIKKE